MQPLAMSWSGGKDSALALFELLRDPAWKVVELLTTVSEEYRRISHHGVREELLQQQAAALGLPLRALYLPSSCTREQYREIMRDALRELRDHGVEAIGHGDLFLEDLRAQRERNLAEIGMRGIFPLWGRDTHTLVKQFTALGFQAYLSYVTRELGAQFAGRRLDSDLIAEFPPAADPCGENGEYHTFVWDGPIFERPLRIQVGAVVERDTGIFADLLPMESG